MNNKILVVFQYEKWFVYQTSWFKAHLLNFFSDINEMEKKNKNSWKSLPTRTMYIKKQLNNSNLISSWIIYNYISLLYLPKKYRSPGMRVKILAITRHNNRFRIGVATTEIIPYDSENLVNRKQKKIKIFQTQTFFSDQVFWFIR